MAEIEIHLFGGVHVSSGRTSGGFRSQRERALLAYLAVERSRAHPRADLADLLWPDRMQEQSRSNLRVLLHRLRKGFEDLTGRPDVLLVGREAVQLAPDADVWTDVQAMQDALATADRMARAGEAASPERLALLHQGVSLYRGDFLHGLEFDDSPSLERWAMAKRDQARGQLLAALEELGEAHLRRGELPQALGEAQRQLELEPWRERAHRQVIRILAHGGDREAALAQYARCRQALAEELGVEPEEETRRLHERILALRRRAPDDLVRGSAPILGREAELGAVVTRLSDPSCRLLTLMGPGGVGKTRLALEAARRTAGAFMDGVWFVALGALQSPAELPAAIASAAGAAYAGQSDPEAYCLGHFREREALLVLDNFENVLEGAALLPRLLHAAPDLKVLVTTRERLGLQLERVIELRGLSCPQDAERRSPAEYGAGRLFVNCVDRLKDGWQPGVADWAPVARLCRTVGGLPLAIELAAHWISVMTPSEMAAEMARGTNLLVSREADRPPRHQSIRAVFDESWQRLGDHDRRVLAALSVFPGTFDRTAAEAVAGASLPGLRNLVDRSLVEVLHSGTPGTPAGTRARFSLHQLLRAFARDHLDETPLQLEAARAAFARHYTGWLAGLRPAMRTKEEHGTLQEVRREYPNVRLALDVACEARDGRALADTIRVLLHYFVVAHHSFRDAEETFARIAAALDPARGSRLDADAAGGEALAYALLCQGWYAMHTGAWDRAEDLTRGGLDAARRYGADQLAHEGINTLALLAMHRGQHGLAESLFQEGLAKAKAAGDLWFAAAIRMNLSRLALQLGRLDAASESIGQALDDFVGIGHSWGITTALIHTARIELAKGEASGARRHLAQALALAERDRNVHGEAQALLHLGECLLAGGEPEPARDRLDSARRLCRELGLHQETSHAEALLARVSYAEDGEAVAPPVGLTPRELEVVTLLARGLTNSQIAKELTISAGTAGVHVTHILSKLGLQSRWQIVDWAVARQIVSRR